MSDLVPRITEYVKEKGIRYSISTPLEEADPVLCEDGRWWKTWKHTGDLTVHFDGKRYHAYCAHDLPGAWDAVHTEIARDLGL